MTVSPIAFWNRLTEQAGRTALIDARDGAETSYQALLAQAEAWRARLPNGKSLVLVTAVSTPATVAAMLGAWRGGHAVCVVNEGLGAERLERLIETYRPAIFVDGDRVELRFERPDYAPPELHPDLALLLSTSGTTGSPKLVKLSFANLAVNSGQICQALGVAEDQRSFLNLPLSYTYGLSVLTSHLAAGASVVLGQGTFLDRNTWKMLDAYQVTTLHGVPESYSNLVMGLKAGLRAPSVRALTQSGGRMGEALVNALAPFLASEGWAMFKMYGMTEATARVAVLPPDMFADHWRSVGFPVPGTAIEIGADGAIIVQGPSVMMGYALDANDLAGGDVCGGVFRTADLGHKDELGLVHIAGRAGRFCKVGGKRLSLDDLEDGYFAGLPAAMTEEDERVFVTLEGDVEGAGERLSRLLADLRLNPNHVFVRSLPALPRSPNGKVAYGQLVGLPALRLLDYLKKPVTMA